MKTLLCFGDSNTHGRVPMPDWNENGRFGFDERWPGVVRKALGPAVHVIEEGHPGRTTCHDDPVEGANRNALRVLEAILETHRPIDVMVIMLGTNDTKMRFSVTAADVARGIERLVRVTRAAGVGPDGGSPKLLIVSPPRVAETGILAGIFKGAAARSAELGPAIAEVARDCGAAFLDADKVIAVSPVDGVHFEREAHARLGAAIADALAKLI